MANNPFLDIPEDVPDRFVQLYYNAALNQFKDQQSNENDNPFANSFLKTFGGGLDQGLKYFFNQLQADKADERKYGHERANAEALSTRQGEQARLTLLRQMQLEMAKETAKQKRDEEQTRGLGDAMTAYFKNIEGGGQFTPTGLSPVGEQAVSGDLNAGLSYPPPPTGSLGTKDYFEGTQTKGSPYEAFRKLDPMQQGKMSEVSKNLSILQQFLDPQAESMKVLDYKTKQGDLLKKGIDSERAKVDLSKDQYLEGLRKKNEKGGTLSSNESILLGVMDKLQSPGVAAKTQIETQLDQQKSELLGTLTPEQKKVYILGKELNVPGEILANMLAPNDLELKKAIEASDLRAGNRAKLTGGGTAAGKQPFEQPPTTQQDKVNDSQMVLEQVAGLSQLTRNKNVDMKKIAGGIAPWVNEIARTHTFLGFPIPDSLVPQYTQEEMKFIAGLHDYADVVLRQRSGATIAPNELERMLKFLASPNSTPEQIRVMLDEAARKTEDKMHIIVDNWSNMGYRSPKEQLDIERTARGILRQNGFSYTRVAIEKFLASPQNRAQLGLK